MADKDKPRVVEAAGMASNRMHAGLGRKIEAAMNAVTGEIEKEVKAIWEDTNQPEEQRREKVAALMDVENIRARKIAARKRVKDEVAAAAAAQLAAELEKQAQAAAAKKE